MTRGRNLTLVVQRRVGVFGGTFDPVHVGHLIVATELRFALALDCVLFVPAGRPPHKTRQEISDNEHRLAMLQLAIDDSPWFAISLVDMQRAGPSYTADTLAILRHELDPVELIFLMGSDSLRDLPTWHEPERIVAQAELGVAQRPGIALDLEQIYASIPNARGRIHLVEVPLIGISSTDIRERVRSGRPIRYQVPLPVEEYIFQHGLYQELAEAAKPAAES